jgi:hypothetical protein
LLLPCQRIALSLGSYETTKRNYNIFTAHIPVLEKRYPEVSRNNKKKLQHLGAERDYRSYRYRYTDAQKQQKETTTLILLVLFLRGHMVLRSLYETTKRNYNLYCF